MNRTTRFTRILCLLVFLAAAVLPGGNAAAASDLVVYGDVLNSGWANWSWNTTANFTATSPVHSGSDSLAVTLNAAWAGLYLAANQAVASRPLRYPAVLDQWRQSRAVRKYAYAGGRRLQPPHWLGRGCARYRRLLDPGESPSERSGQSDANRRDRVAGIRRHSRTHLFP